MKKLISFIIILCFLSSGAKALELSAKSAVLIDGVTGRILYAHNCYERLPMASTTKIMTALLALEKGNPDDIVTVSNNAAYQEGSSLYLKPGEKIKLIDLVYGLMLNSGNDAAVAIAEHISGNVTDFAKLMTDRAHEIGAYNTSFKNPNGLDAEGHYTTAADLALITKVAYENTNFEKIVSTKSAKSSSETVHYMTNHNKMLSRYEGSNGVKTGFTKKSGRSLVSGAKRDGWQVIAVTINAPDDWNDHTKMLDYAFDNFKNSEVVKKGDFLGSANVNGGTYEKVDLIYKDSLFLRLSDQELSRIEINTVCSQTLDAPVKIGQVVGESVVSLDGTVMGRCQIVTNDVSPVESKKNLMDSLVTAVVEWLLLVRDNKMIV